MTTTTGHNHFDPFEDRRARLLREIAQADADEAGAKKAGISVEEYRRRSREREWNRAAAKARAKQAEHDWTPFLTELNELCVRYGVELVGDEGVVAVHGEYWTQLSY